VTRTIVVGDIHGNLSALEELLGLVSPSLDEETTVVFLGDYIDDGPDSRGTIDRLLRFRAEHPGRTVFIKGNHEEWLVRSLADGTRHSWILSMRGLTTIKSYSEPLEAEFRRLMREAGPALVTEKLALPYERLCRMMPDEHLRFLEDLQLSYEDEHCICSHAGVSNPFRGLAAEKPRALLWGDEGFPGSYDGSKLVVYGHFSKLARLVDGRPVPQDTGNTLCLDTIRHGVLSAVVLPERTLVQTRRPPRTVVVIDDKPHALKQVIYEFPGVGKDDLVFRHFQTVESYRAAGIEESYAVFLDFFLSKDRAYGTALIPEIRTQHLVCFSSRKEMSDHMAEEARRADRGRIEHVYSVRKLKHNIENPELRAVLSQVFGAE
jgi:serine/threonine protein phosphatase 1